jgi:hypothetical protein
LLIVEHTPQFLRQHSVERVIVARPEAKKGELFSASW